ncbi:MAG TPA: hypothetical protein VF648_21340 [Pyrinomonadaceae bacterium]|jgi:hypothetical protein
MKSDERNNLIYRQVSQTDIEQFLGKLLSYGDQKDLSEELGRSESTLSSWFNANNGRNLPIAISVMLLCAMEKRIPEKARILDLYLAGVRAESRALNGNASDESPAAAMLREFEETFAQIIARANQQLNCNERGLLFNDIRRVILDEEKNCLTNAKAAVAASGNREL